VSIIKGPTDRLRAADLLALEAEVAASRVIAGPGLLSSFGPEGTVLEVDRATWFPPHPWSVDVGARDKRGGGREVFARIAVGRVNLVVPLLGGKPLDATPRPELELRADLLADKRRSWVALAVARGEGEQQGSTVARVVHTDRIGGKGEPGEAPPADAAVPGEGRHALAMLLGAGAGRVPRVFQIGHFNLQAAPDRAGRWFFWPQ
jgi:hypothetical protein